MPTALEFLRKALEGTAEPAALVWLEEQSQKIKTATTSTPFYLAFSKASRHFKKEPLSYEMNPAKVASHNLDLRHWDSLQTARTYLLLQLPFPKEEWLATLHRLFETGDFYEQQALYAALPLLPYPEEMLPRAIEGCRTNMSVVFDAIALHNPYPAKFFPEANWNQLVVKAIFMQRPLYQIQQLDARRNPTLAAMATDFAHERWAAGRTVMPELWRLLAPFLDQPRLEDLIKAGEASDNPLEAMATALAAFESPYLPAKEWLHAFPQREAACASGDISWEKIGPAFQESRT